MRTYERSWWWVKEKKQMALVLIAITLMLQLQMKGCVGCVETERMGLLQLKSYLNSILPHGKENIYFHEEESILKSWTHGDCCNWEGVKCSDDIGGHIVHLSLYGPEWGVRDAPRQLNLSLLHSFPQLQTFNLWNYLINHFFDPIYGYKSFQRLEKLRTLNFSGNYYLNNSILPFISAARSLTTLDLSYNRLNGVFPPKELANMTELKVMNLKGNSFSSFSVQGLINFSNLEVLNLRYNSITDVKVGDGLNTTKVKTLDLGGNNLNGVFPPNELANMTQLRVLNLQQNGFSSFSVQGLINFSNLEVLDLSDNGMTDIKAGDGLNKTKLKTLDLSYNNLATTTRLEALKYMSKLQELDLSRNGFIDLDSQGLVLPLSLQVLNLASNQLSSTPKVLKYMSKLQELDLSYNGFIDLDSLGLVLPLSLQVLDLSSNQISSTPKGLVLPLSLQVLDLSNNQLSSTPKGYSKICRLTNLQELSLSGNALTNMPYCLGNLSRLRTLDLSDNQLNGSLSFFVSGLPSTIEYLSLFRNNFNGSFWFNSLVNHTKLTVFELSSKVGTIQHLTESSWVPLFQLKRLRLQNFILGSTIHGFLLHQHDLRFLDLSHNKLTGAFPTWLVKNNTRLMSLVLNNNLLTGIQLHKLVHGLQALDISSNLIYNSVQEDIGIVFPKLRYMNYSSNHFQGTIPSSMGEMKSLEILDVSSNSLYGQLPKPFLSNCYSLKFLKLSNNQFQGEIFPEHANLTVLETLYLDGNKFSGNLGKGILNSKWILLLDISENSISGVLPLWIGKMSGLRYLYMSGNKLKGSFPHQLIQSLSMLCLMDISHNRFSGSLPRNVDFPSLKELRLQGNEFVGSVPGTLFKSEELEVLDLRNNSFSRMILNTIGENSNLGVLLLRNNSFQTHIPEEICQLRKIGLLDLSHNKFRGAIPSCLGNMSFGERSDHITVEGNFFQSVETRNYRYASHLYLGVSDLNGRQPRPTAKVEFLTKNRYETYQGEMISYMSGLDLSSNQLSSEIPFEIGNLQNIRSLNLSNNYLTGFIPDSISKLKNLESLDLSNNKLDGNIPSQLADLSGLGYFNVSYNNFSGEIPFIGHLITFDERSYIGNAHLCGRPTNNSCNPVSEPTASNQAKEEEEEESDNVLDMAWFYWTSGAVYISTILAMFVFLFIDSSWSRGWFYWVDLFIYFLRGLKGRFV